MEECRLAACSESRRAQKDPIIQAVSARMLGSGVSELPGLPVLCVPPISASRLAAQKLDRGRRGGTAAQMSRLLPLSR